MNENYEKIVLGLFLQPESLEAKANFISELSPTHFDSQIHKTVFQIIREFIQQRVNPDTINVYLKGKEIDKNVTAVFISGLTDYFYVSFDRLGEYIRILKIISYKREVASVLRDTEMSLEEEILPDNIDKIVHKAIAELSGIELEGKSSFVSLEDMKVKIDEQINSPKTIEGYSWGINKLDLYTSGIIAPRVYVLGGLKKGGKTRFMINTLHSLHEQQIPSGIIELEVPPYEFTKLLVSRFSEINDAYLRNSAFIKPEEKQRLDNLEINWGFFGLECHAGLKIHQIINRIRRMANLGYKVIFLDFLQRIPHDPNRQAQLLEKYSNELADAARNYNVALILLSQYNALSEKEAPTMASLKGSGGIGEAADCILLMDNIYRRTKNEETKGDFDIIIEQRYGDSGTINLKAELGKSLFRDC